MANLTLNLYTNSYDEELGLGLAHISMSEHYNGIGFIFMMILCIVP